MGRAWKLAAPAFVLFAMAAAAETTPPQLVSLNVSPASFDSSSGPVAVSVFLAAHDDGGFAGVSPGSGILFAHQSGSTIFGRQSLTVTNGSLTDPVFQFTVTIPQFSPAGTYNISVTLSDSAQNAATFNSSDLQTRGFPSTLTITPGAGSISLNPSTASAGSGASSGSLQVIASSPSLAWSAASSASWLTIASGAAGTGNGTIGYSVAPNALSSPRTGIITVNGQTFTLTQAAFAPSLNLTPGPLNFNAQVGGAAPAVKTTTVFSSGSPLNFSASASSVGNWLFVSPTAGATSHVLSVWVDPAGLAPGSYNGFVTVSAPGSANGPQTESVNLTVSAGSNSAVTPTSLNFSSQQGSNPPSQPLSVTGIGGFTTSILSSGWLTVTPGNAAGAATLTVSVVSAGLQPGTYSGNITIRSSSVIQTIPVTLTVTAAVFASPASLTFTYVLGAAAPAAQSLTLAGTAATVTLTTTQGTWLSLGAASSAAPGVVPVSVNPAGLAAGTYTSAIVVTVDGQTPQTIPVSLIVTAPTPALNPILSPTSLSFFVLGGVASPASSQVVTVTAGDARPAYSGAASSTGGWLAVTPLNGTLPATLNVSISAAGLASGTYTGVITVTASGSPPVTRTLPVTLTVENLTPGALQVAPSSLEINYQTGDPVPVSQTLALTSSGQAIDFTAAVASAGNWLSVSPSGGSTPATILVQVNPAGLAAGSYTGTIQLNTPGLTPRVIPVSLNVRAPQNLTVSASSLSFSYQIGASSPASQTLTIGCSGSALSFQAAASSAGNWLTTAVPNGVNNQLVVSVNPASLAAGSYSGVVTLTGAGACNRSQAIPVALVVTAAPPAPVTAVPNTLSFSAQAGAAPPPAQSVPIACGSLVYAFSVSSSNSWLRASPSSGSTPGTIVVSVDAGGLNPGSYSGFISIVTPAACAGNVVAPVNLVVTPAVAGPAPITSSLSFAQAALTFAASAGGSAPPAQDVTLGCNGAIALFTATAISTGGWLRVSPSSGNTPATLSVSVNPAGLAPGSYSGSIAASSAVCGAGATLPVTLTVTGIDNVTTGLTIAPASLTFHFQLGGSAPAAQSLAISGAAGQSFTLSPSAGSGWLSASPIGAAVPATVSVSVNPAGLAAGTYSGTIYFASGSASSGTSQSVSVTLNVSGSAPPPVTAPGATPRITSLVNAASYLASPLAPGEIISIFGSNLGPAEEEELRLTASNLVDSSLGGTRVIIDGKAAPILFTHSGQINTIVPYSTAGKQVIELRVEYQGVQSAAARFSVADAAPAIFTIDGSGRGQAALLNQDTSVNSNLNPADRGSIAVLYASGAGVMTPPGQDGAITGTTLPRPVLPVSVLVDGQETAVLYAGAAPGLVSGVLQVNFRLPAQARTGGAVGILLKVGRFTSQAGVTMAIR